MTRITIAGEASVPEPVGLGDKLRITAVVQVHSLRVDLIDVSRISGPPEMLPGEFTIEAVFVESTVEPA